MIAARAVCVHELAQARLAVGAAAGLGCGLILLSAPGAGGYAGCGWWQALIDLALAEQAPDVARCADLLDCGGAAGTAMAALRSLQRGYDERPRRLRGLVLDPATPALDAVRAAATPIGVHVVTARPDCLDLDSRGAARLLPAWLLS